jgi:hypothetical protein
MPSPIYNVALARAAQRLPIIKRVPLAWMIIAAEVAMLAKNHYEHLNPPERRRLVVLLKDAKLQPRNMSRRDRNEFERLVAKLEPTLFARSAVEKFSPVPPRKSVTK